MPTNSASITIPIITHGFIPPIDNPAPSQPKPRTGRYRPHKFFDDPPSGTRSGTTTRRGSAPGSAQSRKTSFSSSDLERSGFLSPLSDSIIQDNVIELEVSVEERIAFAHYGYVYALQAVTRPDGTRWLVSGSGDSDIKIWLCHPGGGLSLLRVIEDLTGAVLSLSVRDSLLYAGMQDGEVAVWDLETGARIRTIEVHEADVLTMTALGDDVYTAAADGRVFRVNGEFDCTAAFRAHAGPVLSSTNVRGLHDRWEIITAGNDSYVKVRIPPLSL